MTDSSNATGRRVSYAIGALVLLLLSTVGGAAAQPAGMPHEATTATLAAASHAYDVTKTLSRTHLVDGADRTVDKKTVTVTVDTTSSLKDRQAVNVTWSGAHPTGGVFADRNSGSAATEEYPVVVMQCRGVDSASAPAAQRIRPETCWTQTPDERFQYAGDDFGYTPYRMDRFARTEDRAAKVNQPDPLPDGCPDLTAPHWVPFLAADGTTYAGGRLGCGGLAPEAANAADSLQPGSTTYGVADKDGEGSAKFVMQNADSNASLGCSDRVVCTLVVIPVMGISCDAAGTATGDDLGMPAADRPDRDTVGPTYDLCSQKGHFSPGEPGSIGNTPDLAVTGSLWWAASNWRNRFSVPLTFAPSASTCDIVGNAQSDPLFVYGSENMLQATQQWGPYLCTSPKLDALRHVQTSEPQAKNLLGVNAIPAAFQAGPPESAFSTPTVQAPTALSGWTIAYSVDGPGGRPYSNLKLNARLIAKLLSESYAGCVGCLDYDSKKSKQSGFSRLARNPVDLSRDPEFQALNPGVRATSNLQAASTLEFMSSDSDTITALSSYINADPEAREWLNGYPDPWGMLVNPAYKNIALPVTNWPLLDTTIARSGSNQCLEQDPVPWLPLVASPVSNPATIALHLQFDIANSQINCRNNGAQNQKLGAIGRQDPGDRFVLGLVSYSDATQYQIQTAQLQTQRTSSGDGEFDDAAGRYFVGPTTNSVAAAAKLMTPNDAAGTWTASYDKLRSSAGRAAYPGTLLLSTDVPTKGLGKKLASQYAGFLRFAAGRGQQPGRGIGDLPAGYVPLNSRNGLAGFSRYTTVAAAAVAAQSGVVPNVSGKPLPAGATRAATNSPTNGAATGTGNNPAASAPGGPAAAAPNANPSTAPKVTTPSAIANAVPAGKTTGLSAGLAGLLLPLLAMAAAIAFGFTLWSSGVGRR